MRKFVLTAILIILGVRFGVNYILSEKFQVYADQKKYPWTCQFNNTLAGIFQITSDYQNAYDLYERTLARCPETRMAEVALYQKAVCLEDLYRPLEAMTFYKLYMDTYPSGERFRNANMAADRLKFSK